eukprot:6208307-Pleurochrysis_carterae.AAC.4
MAREERGRQEIARDRAKSTAARTAWRSDTKHLETCLAAALRSEIARHAPPSMPDVFKSRSTRAVESPTRAAAARTDSSSQMSAWRKGRYWRHGPRIGAMRGDR